MKPEKVKRKPRTMNGERRRTASELNARTSSITAPVTLGATVYRFVLTVV